MASSVMLGDVKLTLVSDGEGHLEGAAAFYPALEAEWSTETPALSGGVVGVVFQSLLVTQGGVNTLVDTGYGEEEPEGKGGELMGKLAALGVQPKDIGRVIVTHAHGDHCMGNTLRRAGRWLPAYPLAEVVIQDREAKWAQESNPELWLTRFEPLAERGQIRIIDSTTALDETLTCWKTPGHTPGHQSVRVHTAEGDALFVGDLVIRAGNWRRLEWGPEWAWSRVVDEESRREVAAWAAESGSLLVVGHDPETPWVRLRGERPPYSTLSAKNVAEDGVEEGVS